MHIILSIRKIYIPVLHYDGVHYIKYIILDRYGTGIGSTSMIYFLLRIQNLWFRSKLHLNMIIKIFNNDVYLQANAIDDDYMDIPVESDNFENQVVVREF